MLCETTHQTRYIISNLGDTRSKFCWCESSVKCLVNRVAYYDTMVALSTMLVLMSNKILDALHNVTVKNALPIVRVSRSDCQ